MYLITFRSRINPRSNRAAEELSGIGGAYVNRRIYFKDYEASEKLAKILISGAAAAVMPGDGPQSCCLTGPSGDEDGDA